MTIHELMQTMGRYTALTESALTQYLDAPNIPQRLKDSMAYSLFAGGKRLRPCLALAACELLGGEDGQVLPLACALEMIHTYSLIHDDLPAMDNDDYRRGKLTNHKVFGEGPAILAGDGLLSYAIEIALSHCAAHDFAAHLVQATKAVFHGAGVTGMVAGQSLDLEAEKEHLCSEDLLQAIHRGKTAAMLIASVEAGGLCANGSQEALQALHSFGAYYGLLFQITDDILDVVGDAKQMGKTLGKDAANGKLTYPALYGLSVAREKAQQAAKAAKDALVPLAQRDTAFFLALVDYTLKREI